jgi:hypothetical protein
MQGFLTDNGIGIPIQSITVIGTKSVRYRWWFIFYKEGFQGPHMYIEFVAVQNSQKVESSFSLVQSLNFIYMLDCDRD